MACDFAALACDTLFAWPPNYDLHTYEDLDRLVADVLSSEGSGDIFPCRNPVTKEVGLHRPDDGRAWIVPISVLTEKQQELAASPQGTATLFDREECL